jgi:uncharacterized protein YigA (DUF484 family)
MNDQEILKATNDEIARKFRGIEADLLVCREIGELFAKLLSGSEAAFGIPFVWLSLLARPETEALLALLEKDGLRDRVSILSPASFREIVPDAGHTLLASGELKPFFRLLPAQIKYLIRSLAVAPLTCSGCLVGSLNHGDTSAERYRSGMDTALLDHLARMVSERITQLLPQGSPDWPGTGS